MSTKNGGFTLPELVVTIVILGVLAAVGSQIFMPALASYRDARTRAELSEMADALYRQIARDVQRAVPNSLLLPESQCLLLIPSRAAALFRRDRDLRDGPDADLDPDHPGNPLDLTSGAVTAGETVDLLSPLDPEIPEGQAGWIVIGAQTSPTAGSVAGSPYDPNLRAKATLRSPTATATHSGWQIEWNETASGKAWTTYPGSKAFWVDQREAMVAYRCVDGELRRGVAAAIDPSAMCAASGWSWTTLARRLDASAPCQFARVTTQVAAETVWVRFQTRSASGEILPFAGGIVVDRTP